VPAPGDPQALGRPIASIRQAARLAAISLAALLAPDAFAQGHPTAPRWPTAQEIDRAKAERPIPAPEAPIPTPRALPRIGPGSGEGAGVAQRLPATGAGISLRLRGVQIIELREPSGGRAEDFGFGAEATGYVAESFDNFEDDAKPVSKAEPKRAQDF
jgi:hypothetical protein